MTDPRIRIGIGGWTYPPWRGSFYPEGLPQKRELEFASKAFTTLEINSTFYSRQSPKSWETWGKTVPDDFQFAIKGSRYCVMRSKLADGAEGIANFFAQGFEALGPNLGPIMWQFAPRRKLDLDDVAGFIDLLPEKLNGIALRHAIEPRHESFRNDQFFDLCRARNIAIVLDDSEEFPTIEAGTADFAYMRLQRMSEEVTTGYAKSELDEFAEQARKLMARGDVFIFMINGAKVRAPAAGLALRKILSV